MSADVTCRQGLGVLMEYTEGLLPQRSRQTLEAHVAGCVRCQGFLRSYLAVPGILRRATEEPLPASAGRALRRRLSSTSAGSARGSRGPRTPPRR